VATISLPERLLRTLCGVIAATLIAGTVLVVGLAVNLFGAPPAIPETADLPTRLLLQKPFEQSIWPVDMAASLLYAVALGAVILLAAVLYTAVDAGRPLAVAPLAALGAGGILGAAAQLLYVGAKAPIIDIQYCDCGFKAEEVISQQWALILVQGAQSWLINARSC
jgi:hypothetical protein